MAWKRTINDEYIATGGGFNYYITFYRNRINPKKQIEIFVEVNRGRRGRGALMNIGTLPKGKNDKYEFIQGEYSLVKSFRSLNDAKVFAMKYMRKYPSGMIKRKLVKKKVATKKRRKRR